VNTIVFNRSSTNKGELSRREHEIDKKNGNLKLPRGVAVVETTVEEDGNERQGFSDPLVGVQAVPGRHNSMSSAKRGEASSKNGPAAIDLGRLHPVQLKKTAY